MPVHNIFKNEGESKNLFKQEMLGKNMEMQKGKGILEIANMYK